MKTEKTKEIVVLEKKVSKLMQAVENQSISSNEEMMQAGELRKEIKTVAKTAKEEKEKATKPLNDVLKTIRDWFAPLEENCKKAIVIVESEMRKYQNEIDEKRRKAEAEAQKIVDAAQKKLEEGKMTETAFEKTVEKLETKLETVPEVITKSEDFHTRVIKKVRIVDALLIPREYLVPDTVKINTAVKSGTIIPGCELYEEQTFV